jgi:hypothetical protein
MMDHLSGVETEGRVVDSTAENWVRAPSSGLVLYYDYGNCQPK